MQQHVAVVVGKSDGILPTSTSTLPFDGSNFYLFLCQTVNVRFLTSTRLQGLHKSILQAPSVPLPSFYAGAGAKQGSSNGFL